jgi:predicted O-methyltransferase YrrM
VSERTSFLPADVYQYILAAAAREPPVLARLREATAPMPGAEMQITPEQGQFMALLVRLIGARRCLDIGTYTGYSALAVALALPTDGELIACDVNQAWTAVAGAPIVQHRNALSKALRAFNEHVHHDERVELSLLPIGEGLTLLRKR